MIIRCPYCNGPVLYLSRDVIDYCSECGKKFIVQVVAQKTENNGREAELRNVLRNARTLLEALRLDNGVGQLLNDPQKQVYHGVEKQIADFMENHMGDNSE